MTGPTDVMIPFLERSRWFGGKGRGFTVAEIRRLGEVPGGVEDGPRVVIDVVVVDYTDSDEGGEERREMYQVPLAFYPEPQERLEHALVGTWSEPELGTGELYAYDAVHDHDAMASWLRSFDLAATRTVDPDSPLAFHRLPGHDLDLGGHSTLFSGEQSNSSVAFGEDSLMKVFRKLTPGVNPDIAIHEVLTRTGSDHVAGLYGWLDIHDEASDSVIQLAMLQQFLRTASDGWDLALVSVRNLFAEADLHAHEVGGDFAGESARLGVALAEVHADLAEHFPVERLGAEQMAELATAMRRRLDEALAIVPGLEPHADGLRAAYDRVAALDDVPVQRVHCDLHLGQTLRTSKGWKIVDFEGEPAKPLAERMLPDSPWRDVAGMLRSFDYAPRVVERTLGEGDANDDHQRAYRAEEWAERNRTAFLEAYAGRELTPDETTLLAAYVADKAVYETVYETRNRPGWVSIPLAAVARIGAAS
ncbi:maltokinase N-terminal cap-like domain-containing protein [Nocardioides pacificus]